MINTFRNRLPPKSGKQRQRLFAEALENRILLAAENIMIDEIMYHSAGGNTAEEFIELHNSGTTAVDLTDWQFTSGVNFTFPATSIDSSGYLVVAADPLTFSTLYPTIANIVGPWSGRLSNNGESIVLRDASGQKIDRVAYADEGDWSHRTSGPDDHGTRGWVWTDEHDGGGKSLELVNSAISNNYGQNWSESLLEGGTPGTANSVAKSDSAPLILKVLHDPPIPRSFDAVNITTQILDEHSSGFTVHVHWRVDGDPSFSQQTMVDKGLHGDGEIGDGIFGATLPSQPDGTVVEFYITSQDPGLNQRSWPEATISAGQVANLLYQVDDAFDPASVWTPGTPVEYRQIMTGGERQEFESIHRVSDAQMNATLITISGTDVDIRYNVGIRIRGSGSRFHNPPNNRINIPSDRPWQGRTAMNINAVGIANQIAGSLLFRLAGLSAPEAKPVRMLNNGANLYGEDQFYAHVEVLDSEFATNHFPLDDGGNLYKGRRPDESPPGGLGAGLAYFGPDPSPYVSYVKLTNATDADWSDVIELTFQLNHSPDTTFVQEVEAVADIDQWLRFLALNTLIGNNEVGLLTGDPLGDDYAMYRGVDDTRFRLIPHDLDTLFQGIRFSPFRAAGNPALARLLEHPELLSRYYLQLLDLINNFLLTETTRSQLQNALSAVRTAGELVAINTFLSNRASFAFTQIPSQGLSMVSDLPLVGEFPFTTEERLNLSGTADLDTQSVLINGQQAALSLDHSWHVGSLANSTTLVPSGSIWNFLDDGSNQGTEWREKDFVVDPSWGSGPAQLGYGDADEQTVVGFGPNSRNKFPTTYFRHEFEISDPSQYTTLLLRLLRDDGAAVYLNGVEIARDNLVPNAGYRTLASDFVILDEEDEFFEFAIDSSLLVIGTNSIAAEVHQVSAANLDLSFDLELSAQTIIAGPAFSLNPGINRVVAQSFSGPAGSGVLLDTTYLDIWYDDGDVQTMGGTLSDTPVVWTASSGPYHVTSDVRIPPNGKLIIEPGTSIYFDENRQLLVEGELVAKGMAFRRIRFTSVPNAPFVPDEPGGNTGLPDGPPRWQGIRFVDTMSQANEISFADIGYAQEIGGAIGAIRSNVLIDNVTFRGSHLRLINADSSSLLVQNSVFPDMFSPDETAVASNLNGVAQHIRTVGNIPAGGHLVIRNNLFGTNQGQNDIIDADSNHLPGPILQVIDNVFLGTGDEHLDLTGDVYVADNFFQNAIKDHQTSDPDYAGAISIGNGAANSTAVVVRNIFWNVDHAIDLSDGAVTIFENNTVTAVNEDYVDLFDNVNVGSAINLHIDQPDATAGRGVYATGNIFVDIPRVLGNVDLPHGTTSELEFNDNLLDPDLAQSTVGLRLGTLLDLGSGNLVANPQFVDQALGDFSLTANSPAIGNGPLDQNFGALVPSGAWISGTPPAMTASTEATLTVGGPGIFEYRYRINGGPWSENLSLGAGLDAEFGTVRTDQITFSGLTDGNYIVEVLGRDFAGNWQVTPTASKRWTVNTSLAMLQINELLAVNQGVYSLMGTLPDLVELHNPGKSSVDLSGMSLSDNLQEPTKFVFAAGTTLSAGEYLLLIADDLSTPGIHLGFSLDANGEGLYWFDSVANGGELIDSVEFGLQSPNFSLGRVGSQREWTLNRVTPGAANVQQLMTHPAGLRINEWFASNHEIVDGDFIELYNPEQLPVEVSGLMLSDEPTGFPNQYVFAPRSFIAGQGHLVLFADGNTANGGNHLNFQLSADQEVLGLLNTDGSMIDTVVYYPQTTDVSQGRSPDGLENLDWFVQPSPGYPNSVFEFVETLIESTSTWSYDQLGTDLGTAWREVAYDDDSWPAGMGAFGFETAPLPASIHTPLSLESTTYYFRRHFTLDHDPTSTEVSIETLIDDGAIVYINGMEALRLNMPEGPIDHPTFATPGVSDAVLEGPFNIDSSLLVQGDNVIAVEVHQSSLTSSDIVFGFTMDSRITSVSQASDVIINEVHYHPENPEPGELTESELEFVELLNTTQVIQNISGWVLGAGIDFSFPSSTTLPAGKTLVVVSFDAANEPAKSNAFRQRFDVPASISLLGPYFGALGNGGDIVELRQPFELTRLLLGQELVDRVHYSDSLPWPPSADGKGSSITRTSDSPFGDAAGSWFAATPSPGQTFMLGDFNRDHAVNATDIDLLHAAIGTNSNDLSFDLDGSGSLGSTDVDFLVKDILHTNYGDIDLDGDVDTGDLTQMIIRFSGASGSGRTWANGDTNGDGDVDTADLTRAIIGFTGAVSK